MSFARLAVRLDPDFSEAWALIGAAAEVYEDRKTAAAAYGRVTEESALYPDAVLGRARALDSLGRTAEAIGVLRVAREKDPDARYLALPLADLLIRDDRGPEALAVVSGAADAALNTGQDNWRLEVARGALLLDLGREEAAIAALRRAVKFAPEEPEALNYLGYTLAERGVELAEAERLLAKAKSLNPTSGAILDSYGWAQFQLRNYEAAVEYLEDAVALDPTSPVITDHLGDAYWRTGRRREAEFEWRRALELDPEPDLRKAIEQKLRNGLPPSNDA
ncbi:MAG: tetratricopeptide repeat protein [Pseudomonadota bacterium]